MISAIYEIDDLQLLRQYLDGFTDVDALRAALWDEFLRHSRYSNATEWNRAVRVCEALAITGWGDREPLEAVRGMYFNGAPNTYFINATGKPRFLDAVWSRRGDGMAIDFSRSTWHGSPDDVCDAMPFAADTTGEPSNESLKSQRNWIAKNPILITRGLDNCYANSRPVIESIEHVLKPALDRGMRPELYGSAIDRIVLNLSFSFFDDYHCKTNYIIADESLKLKQKDYYPALLAMYPEREIDDNGYFLRPRYSYGPFRKATGTTRVVIVFEREFSEMTHEEQRQALCRHMLHALRQCAVRIGKKIDYDFRLMLSDFAAILDQWCLSDIG